MRGKVVNTVYSTDNSGIRYFFIEDEHHNQYFAIPSNILNKKNLKKGRGCQFEVEINREDGLPTAVRIEMDDPSDIEIWKAHNQAAAFRREWHLTSHILPCKPGWYWGMGFGGTPNKRCPFYYSKVDGSWCTFDHNMFIQVAPKKWRWMEYPMEEDE